MLNPKVQKGQGEVSLHPFTSLMSLPQKWAGNLYHKIINAANKKPTKFLAASQGWRRKCEGFRLLLQHSGKFLIGTGGSTQGKQILLRGISELWGLS
jgi:hypothetical protein